MTKDEYIKSLELAALLALVFLGAVILILCIALRSARGTVASQEEIIATQERQISELRDQRDAAYRQLAEWAAEDAPITPENQSFSEKIDSTEADISAENETSAVIRGNRTTELVGNSDELQTATMQATSEEPSYVTTAASYVFSDEVELLARLIFHEIGSDGHPDEQLYIVGSVVINRIADSRFPSTLHDVIYQRGQYAPAINGTLYKGTPTQRCYDIAADLLANGSTIPSDVVWQSGDTQGTEIWQTYHSPVTGATMYYCR